MELKATPLSPGDQVPTMEEIADRLVTAVPARQRRAAREVLVRDLLPVALRGLETPETPRQLEFGLTHRSLVEYVFDEIALILHEAPPRRRLRALRARVYRERLSEHRQRAVFLAKARYLHDKGSKLTPELLEQEFSPEALAAARALSVEEIEAEASERLRQLEKWRFEVERRYPEARDPGAYLWAVLSLRNARTGDFFSSGGGVSDFLEAVGEPTVPHSYY